MNRTTINHECTCWRWNDKRRFICVLHQNLVFFCFDWVRGRRWQAFRVHHRQTYFLHCHWIIVRGGFFFSFLFIFDEPIQCVFLLFSFFPFLFWPCIRSSYTKIDRSMNIRILTQLHTSIIEVRERNIVVLITLILFFFNVAFFSFVQFSNVRLSLYVRNWCRISSSSLMSEQRKQTEMIRTNW